MLFEVEQEFNAAIRAAIPNQQAHAYVSNHERKGKCLTELCHQIRLCELSNIGQRFDVAKYRNVIKSVARMFATQALRYAEEQALSLAERNRRLAEADRITECEGIVAEMEREAQQMKSFPGKPIE